MINKVKIHFLGILNLNGNIFILLFAEITRFELVGLLTPNGFQDRRLNPLSHISVESSV